MILQTKASNNAKLEVTSDNAQFVFQQSGSKRDLELVDGIVAIGLHPNASLLTMNQLKLDLLITADNYLDVRRTVIFDPAFNAGIQSVDIAIIKLCLIRQENFF